MAIVTDYFAAPSDALAATVLHEESGPSTPTRGSGQPLFDTVCLPSIEPFVMLGTLAQLLSGRSYGEVTARARHGRLVVGGGDEGPWVVTVSDALAADLAGSPNRRLQAVATSWGRTPELSVVGPDRVRDAVFALAELAGRAAELRHSLYCWTALD